MIFPGSFRELRAKAVCHHHSKCGETNYYRDTPLRSAWPDQKLDPKTGGKSYTVVIALLERDKATPSMESFWGCGLGCQGPWLLAWGFQEAGRVPTMEKITYIPGRMRGRRSAWTSPYQVPALLWNLKQRTWSKDTGANWSLCRRRNSELSHIKTAENRGQITNPQNIHRLKWISHLQGKR